MHTHAHTVRKKMFENLSKKILETSTNVLSILASFYREKYLSRIVTNFLTYDLNPSRNMLPEFSDLFQGHPLYV